MIKENKIQKKKTVATTVSQTLFKVLIAVAIIVFSLLVFDKLNLSNGAFSFGSDGKNKEAIKTPEQLKWFNDFKGVENVPSRKQQEESGEKKGNFLGF